MIARALAWAAAATLALLVATAGPTLAAEVDAATFRDLAARSAGGDEEALEALLDVDSIDGFAVDVAALVGPDDTARRDRLQTLAAGGDDGGGDAAAARAAAAAILAERPFTDTAVAGGDRSAWTVILDFIDDVASTIFFGAEGSTAMFFLTAAAVLAAALLLGGYLTRRRAAAHQQRRREASAEVAAERPGELEDAASKAEAGGDYSGAIRLRFRAGLLRLDQRGIVPFDPAMTTGRLNRALRTVEASHVARLFDEVVYGGRPATARDADETRSGWKAILARRPSA